MTARQARDAHAGAAGAEEEGDGALSPLQRLVRNRLRERNWSYGEVARRAGLPKSTIHHLATSPMRSRPPKPATLEGLARGLELPLSAVRAAAAEDAGLHFYDESQVDPETALLIASIEELSPDDRRHVAALIESLRRRSPQ